jgi:hypothetical protein
LILSWSVDPGALARDPPRQADRPKRWLMILAAGTGPVANL